MPLHESLDNTSSLLKQVHSTTTTFDPVLALMYCVLLHNFLNAIDLLIIVGREIQGGFESNI